MDLVKFDIVGDPVSIHQPLPRLIACECVLCVCVCGGGGVMGEYEHGNLPIGTCVLRFVDRSCCPWTQN